MNATIRELAKWPTSEDEVTVDGIIRAIGVDAQRTWLQKWETLRRTDADGKALYLAQVESCIAAIGLIGCFRALRVASPDDALGFARMYWQMCEDGEQFGEMLWEWLEDAGLDPELVEKALSDPAVESVVESGQG